MTELSSKPSRGRPKSEVGKSVHDALLSATEQCLETRSASTVTVRQIAQMAGVNQAMIGYYFDSKQSLFVSLIERDMLDLLRKLRSFLKGVAADEAGQYSVESLMTLIEEHFRARPSTFAMTSHDLMDKPHLSKSYNQRLAAKGFVSIVQILTVFMRRGGCRRDLSPEHAAYLVCSVCAMPFLLGPIFEAAFNTKWEGREWDSRRQAMARMLEINPACATLPLDEPGRTS